jgi:hypothetical protein
MSDENVELAMAMADAFNRRDWDAFVALTHDEIRWSPAWLRWRALTRGMRTASLVGQLPRRLSRLHSRGRELRDLGDVTLAHIRGWGHGADSATPVVDPFWQPLRWRDGKCVWWRNCATEAEALEAAGLRE